MFFLSMGECEHGSGGKSAGHEGSSEQSFADSDRPIDHHHGLIDSPGSLRRVDGRGPRFEPGNVCLLLPLYLQARKLFLIYSYDCNIMKMLGSGVCLVMVAWIIDNHLRGGESPLLFLIATVAILYALWGLWVFWALTDAEDRRFVDDAIRNFRGRWAVSRG